ncbi:MAG: ABC transporter ATP-binding protein [Verrucomicrobia bacterium]|nr:ABC transporter ATP-binding protein [Verrucomicrobiota bacterium]
MRTCLIEIENLYKSFHNKEPSAIDGLTAAIPKGKIVGIVGPDGAGKTTLFRLIAALLKPTEGRIVVDGHDTVEEAEAIHTEIGYMPQKFGLYEDLTVLQNLNLYADLRGVTGKEREESFEKLLEFTSLKPFTKRLARDLSGGMKQKLGLASTLIKKPKLLLLDEPTVGVDPLSRQELWKMVSSLREEGISVLWGTSYLTEAEACDTVLLLHEGKLLYFGEPHLLTERVRGRVFVTTPSIESRRRTIQELLKKEEIVDATLQGSEVRFVVKEGRAPPIEGTLVEPRFEDSFIDILGGAPKGESLLGELRAKSASSAPAIVVENITKRFGSFVAVDHVSFTVSRGEIFGLLGPNGAGKSTTFRMLCGLLPPSEGSATVNGVSLATATSLAKRQIGYMAQKFSLYGALSVKQNLEFFAGIYGLVGKEKEQAVDEMIKMFNLGPYLSSSAETLPLGFKQRLALAASNMHRPEILFLDEPTSGVDPLTRREFWSHIHALVERGVTVMITTHFMEEAEYCDRIALIYQGKVIHMGAPDSLKEEAKASTLEEAFIKLVDRHK